MNHDVLSLINNHCPTETYEVGQNGQLVKMNPPQLPIAIADIPSPSM